MERDTNNFIGWFPNGYKRRFNLHKQEPGKSIVKDLDKLLEESNFDFKKFEELSKNRVWNYNQMKLLIFSNNEVTEEAERYYKIGKKIDDKIEEMIMPYYNKMVELGYDEHDLAV